MKFKLSWYRQHQGKMVLFAALFAFICGISLPHQIFINLAFIGNIFIRLLKLCALPIIVTSLITAVGTLSSTNALKTIARNGVIYILASEIIAVTIGLIVFNFATLHTHIDPKSLLLDNTYSTVATTTHISVSKIVSYLISDNIFQSLANFDVLPVVIFSIIIGIACALQPLKAKPMLDFLSSVRNIFMYILDGVILLAPPAIFVLVGENISYWHEAGKLTADLFDLAKFVCLFIGALFLHFLWQTGLVKYLYPKLTLAKLFTTSMPMFSTAFVSSSSLATLPVALEAAEELGGNKQVVEFMLPICASMNFSSGMMYEMMATLFFAHILGIDPTLLQQLLLAIVCILTGIAVGGIPETSMTSFVTVFSIAHIPLSALGILMPLDRILDRIRTMVNIFGNTCGTLVVSRTIKKIKIH